MDSQLDVFAFDNTIINNKKKKKKKCSECNKNYGLMGFDCKCGHTFCGIHKHTDSHNCQFNYKYDYQQKLLINNPKITTNKIDKI